jgi:hypothetical protein
MQAITVSQVLDKVIVQLQDVDQAKARQAG